MNRILFLLFFIITGKLSGQVNLQTGSATFSLPMFNWQDNKSRLNAVVGLNYNSGNGLKVNAVASNVGQNWSLLAGGVITRIQHGEPDDQKAYFEGTAEQPDDTRKYGNGYLYNNIPVYYGAPAALTKYPTYKEKNHLYKPPNTVTADRELDHFAFDFNGRTGIFIVSKINSDLSNADPNQRVGTGEFLGDSKMKIAFVTDENMYNGTQKVRTTIKSFTITDENGLIYKFAYREFTKLLKINYCDENLNKRDQPKFKDDKVYHEASWDEGIANPWVINGWYLTEIEDQLTHRKINYTYSDKTLNTAGGATISNITSNNSGVLSRVRNYSVISHTTAKSVTPRLTSIVYQDGHQVLFNYGKERIDLPGDNVLSSVDIKYNGRFLSRYQLTTSYFILNRYGIPVTNYQKACARLCLRSVKKIGVDLKGDDPPYQFDYFLGSNAADDVVPPPFDYHKDIWGYYNGGNSTADNGGPLPISKPLNDLSNNELRKLCFYNRDYIYNAKNGYAKNGLLKQIIYPTGGSLNYSYAQNMGSLEGQYREVGGIHVSSTKVMDGGYQTDCDQGIVTNYNYTLAGSSVSSLWGLEPPENKITVENHFKPEYKIAKLKFPYTILNLTCDYKYKYPGILSREQAVSVTIWEKIITILSEVKQVIDLVSDALDAIKYFSDAAGGTIVGIVITIVVDLITTALDCFGDHVIDNISHIYYNSDIAGPNALPAQFKRVEVIENSGANGKTVYDFTDDVEYGIWVSQDSYKKTFSAEQRYASWAYGLSRFVTVYDASGNIVKQTENVYDYTKAHRKVGIAKTGDLYWGYANCKYLIYRSNSQRYYDWENPLSYDYSTNENISANYLQENASQDINVRLYAVYSGRVELQDSYERIYKPGSSTKYLETRTHYQYSTSNYQVNHTSTTQSNGDIIYKDIKYSSELVSMLATKNILNIPVSITTSISKPGEGAKYLGEKVTEFIQLANGDIKPSRILEQRFSQPKESASMTFYQGQGSPFNPPYKEIQSFSYDGVRGILIGMKDEGNHTVANIYNYSDKYVVAYVVNADVVLDRPSYSSFETLENGTYGGWNLTGTISPTTQTSITGSSSFILSGSNSLSATVNTAKSYILSFWATNTISISPSATLLKSAPVINGFTYYEYIIPQGTSSLTVSGNATIDELRLYPTSARMKSVTYDPLIGKTSECDENNRITYYEYDEKGRLRFIKDENRNVVKMYEYNVAIKIALCPVTYTNLTVSEIFVKNNCSEGNSGEAVVYTIPAGSYTSTVSQEVVDQLVQNDLITNGQNYANTNGTCRTIYYNTAISETFTKEGCDVGYEGSTVTYTVPANKYTSLISAVDAQEKAQDEVDANGQAYANAPGNGACILSTAPDWVGTGRSDCNVNSDGGFNGELLMEFIDQNPNSSTYNQTMWVNAGASSACDQPPVADLKYTNTLSISATASLTNIATGHTYTFLLSPFNSPNTIVGQMPVGNYNVTISADGALHYFRIYNLIQDGVSMFNAYHVPLCATCASITVQQ